MMILLLRKLLIPSDPTSDSYVDIKVQQGTEIIVSRTGNPIKLSDTLYRVLTDSDSPDNWAVISTGNKIVKTLTAISPDNLYDINNNLIDAIVVSNNQYSVYLVLDSGDKLSSSNDIAIVKLFPTNPNPQSKYYLLDLTNAGLNPYILYTPKSSCKTYKIPILTIASGFGSRIISYLSDTENVAVQIIQGWKLYDQYGNLLPKAKTQIDGTDWDYYIVPNQKQVLIAKKGSGKVEQYVYISPLQKPKLVVPENVNIIIMGPFAINVTNTSSNMSDATGGSLTLFYNGQGDYGSMTLNLPGNQNINVNVIFI